MLSPRPAAAEDRFEAMGRCYQASGQIETVTTDGKRVTTYKDPAEVAAECNAKVLARAQTETRVEDALAWARVIGTHSNWQSAVPVFTIAARLDATHATCTTSESLYALELSLGSPVDDPQAVAGAAFVSACWPAVRDALVGLLPKGGYPTQNACKLLTDRKALPDGKKWLCAK
jgi:alkylated DNA nucleotide flippase Atl1